jgi:hypothetical protein
MKLILLFLLTTTTFACPGARAQTKWVSTSFWSAPQATRMKIALRPGPDLPEECESYQNLLFSESGELRWVARYPEKIARLRKSVDPIRFDLFTGGQQEVEELVEARSDADERPGVTLPHYLQTRAITMVFFEELTQFETRLGENSMTSISRGLGLPDTEVSLQHGPRGSLQLETSNLDLACDLFSGKASISTIAPASVNLLREDSQRIHNFYNNKLMPRLAGLFTGAKKARVKRAARIGYRIGSLIEKEGFAQDGQEDVLLEKIFGLVFNPDTLEPSHHVVQVGTQRLLHIDSSAEAASVTLTLEL